MLAQQLIARCRSSRLPSRALHNPLWRFKHNRSDRHTQSRHDASSNLTLDFRRVGEKFFTLNLSHYYDVFRPEIWIVNSHGYHAPIVDRSMSSRDFFNVLGIEVFPADDQQILLTANDVQLAVQLKAQVPGVVPAVAQQLGTEVRPVEIAPKKAVALDQ